MKIIDLEIKNVFNILTIPKLYALQPDLQHNFRNSRPDTTQNTNNNGKLYRFSLSHTKKKKPNKNIDKFLSVIIF